MAKRKFSILTKVGVFYLLFTLISFFVTAFVLHREATWHMDNILENRLEQREHWVTRLLERKSERAHEKSYALITPVTQLPGNFKPYYKDTIIQQEDSNRKEIFRKRINYITVNEKNYRIEVIKSAAELYRFKDDIYEIIVPVFIVLALLIILTNYLLSGYLFSPFKFILKQMANFNLTKKNTFSRKQTSTREFHHMQELFESMLKRIEKDYEQLKTYTENMSHELQTPLSIIRNRTEQLLSNEDLDQKQAEKVKSIYDSVQQLSRLGSLLNLITKINNEEFVNVQEVPTAKIIEQHVQSVADFATNKKLNFETRLDQNHSFRIDPGLLDILFRNLIKNAIAYSATGSEIRIETMDHRFLIANEGPELEFDPSSIFNRFKKGNNSKSLGLGLAIAKQICQISNLNLSYNRTGQWHTFTIEKT